MFERESGKGATTPRRKPRRSPSRATSSKPVGVLAPPKAKPTGVFASPQPKAPDVGQARQRAQTQRARRDVERTTSVAVVPKVQGATRVQRQTARDLAIRSLGEQGIKTRADVAALPPRERQRANRLLGYVGTQQKRDDAATAVRQPTRAPTRLDRLSQELGVPELTERPQTVQELARVGRQVASSRAVRLRPRAPHGLKSGASLLGAAAIHLDPGTALRASKILGAAALKGAVQPVADALRGAGAGSDDNALKHAAQDAIHFPYDAVNSAVEVGKAVVDLSKYLPHGARTAASVLAGPLGVPLAAVSEGAGGKGSAKRAERIIAAQDAGVVGALVGGHGNLALDRLDEHPLYGALEVAGTVGAAGRILGAVGRSGAVGGRVAEALATDRANLRSSRHGGAEEQRSYSKNAITNRLQKAFDAHDVRRGRDPNLANASQADRMLRRAANEEVSASEDLRRADVQAAGRDATMAVRGGKRGPAVSEAERTLRDLVGSAAEGKLGSRADLRDVLAEEHKRVADVFETDKFSMSLPQRRASLKHQKRLKLMTEVVAGKHGEEAAAQLFERAGAYSKVANRQTQDLVDLHALAPEQAVAARLRTFAVTRLGAKDDPRRAPTAADEAARSAAQTARRATKITVSRAVKELGAAKEDLAATRAAVRGRAARRRAAVVKPGESLGRNRAESVVAYMKRVEDAPPEVRSRLARGEKADAKKVATAKARVKAAKAAHRDARVQLKAIKVPGARKFRTGLVIEDGRGGTRKLTLAEIKTSWEAAHPGEPLPAFVSHVDRSSEGARFVNYSGADGPRRLSPDAHRRTGEAARRGTAGVDERAAIDSVMHTQGVVTAVQNFDRLVQRFGSKRQDGRMFTPQEAELEARARNEAYNTEVPGEDWVPVKATPGKYDSDRIEEIGAAQAAARGDAPVGLIPDQLKVLEAGDIHDPGARNVVLMPRTVVKQIQDAQSPTTSEAAKTLQAFTNVFRGTVLPTSTKWLFGNAAEMALRLALHHGPMAFVDVAHGRRLQAAIEASDKAIGRQLRVRTRGGGVYGSSTRLRIHRNASMFQRPGFRQAARGASAVREAELQRATARDLGLIGKVGPKAVFDGYTVFANTVVRLNKALEEAGQAAVVGKVARREAHEMTRSWAKSLLLQGKTFEALVSGDRVKSVEWATKAAREIDKTLGKYNRFSPEMRRLTQTIAPFLPWYLNSARFVYWTLPVENTVKAALLARVEATFDQDMQKQAKSLPPGDLGANPQRADGGIVPVSRYTPFGAFTPFGREYGSVLQEAASPILPQLTTPLTIAVFGENFAHRTLKKGDGSDVTEGDKARMAAYALFESVVPFTQIGRRLLERGDTGYDDSTVFVPKRKPGTSHGRSAADRILNPVSPTYLQKSGGVRAPVINAGPAAPQTLDQRAAAALAGGVGASTSGLDPDVAARAAAALAGP